MKILVTGANGYMGSRVVKVLCNEGCEVVAADFKGDHVDERAQFIAANIFDEKEDWFSYFGKPDVCLHLAWSDIYNHKSPRHIEEISSHFKFIKNLIDNGLPQVAIMGTMYEIGYCNGAVDENTPCNPQILYAVAKNALRRAVEIYAASKGCKFQWLRAFYMYSDDTYGNNIFCKIRQAVIEGKKSFPFTTGKNIVDFIHIDDLSVMIAKTVMQDKVTGIINVCSGEPKSLAEQVEWYIKKNNLPIKLDYGKYPDREYDSPCIYGDTRKIREILSGD